MVDTSLASAKNVKLLTDLYILNARILAKLGYCEDAMKRLKRAKQFLEQKGKTGLISSSSHVTSKIHMVPCELAMAGLLIEYSRFSEADQILEDCQSLLDGVYHH